MSPKSLLLVGGVACALAWGAASWAFGVTAPKALEAVDGTAASVRQSTDRSAEVPYLEECGELWEGKVTTAQACPPGTCPCRGGDCSQTCC
jgi:hypothetical protein